LRILKVYPRSQILIFVYPGSCILDPGSKNSNKREGWKKLAVLPFCANLLKIIELFTPKNCH
jgi:hypothetical protein